MFKFETSTAGLAQPVAAYLLMMACAAATGITESYFAAVATGLFATIAIGSTTIGRDGDAGMEAWL